MARPFVAHDLRGVRPGAVASGAINQRRRSERRLRSRSRKLANLADSSSGGRLPAKQLCGVTSSSNGGLTQGCSWTPISAFRRLERGLEDFGGKAGGRDRPVDQVDRDDALRFAKLLELREARVRGRARGLRGRAASTSRTLLRCRRSG